MARKLNQFGFRLREDMVQEYLAKDFSIEIKGWPSVSINSSG